MENKDLDSKGLPKKDLQQEASEQLRFIRETMERSASFTDVPGGAMAAIGLFAVLVAIFQQYKPTFWTLSWRDTWILTAIIAVFLGLIGMYRKAKRANRGLNVAPLRKFGMSIMPTIVAAAILTSLFTHQGIYDQYHALWLLLYGAAIMAAGVASIRVVSLMGLCFMILGILAFILPHAISMDMWMAIGFGGLHLIFGMLIQQKHGG